jgi:ribosomal protein S12 methylthiotransferase accessory factor
MIELLRGNFGFINKPKINVARNIFLPEGLFERALYSDNLFTVGNQKSVVNGSGISFKKEQAEIAALGEYVERYASSFQNKNGLIFGSYNELSKIHSCYHPDNVNYYNESQKKSANFQLRKLDIDTPIHWIWCTSYFSKENILLPFFMTNVENIKGDGKFHINTSTGTATFSNQKKAVEAGLIECIERDAFSKFWYLQEERMYSKLSTDFILKTFPKNGLIERLYKNKRVKIVTFDLSSYAYCPTFAVIIYFKKNGKIFQSIGSASRLDLEDALTKACIESYQGIEYAQIVYNEALRTIDLDDLKSGDYNSIDNFRMHFAFYNLLPELKKQIPLFVDAISEKYEEIDWIKKYKRHISNLNEEELKAKGINEMYFVDLTTSDLKQLGFSVVKVITPNLHLLTGDFNYPYLGLFKSNSLFTKYPHPFP